MSKTEGNQVRGSDELSDEPEWSCVPLMTIRDPRKKILYASHGKG